MNQLAGPPLGAALFAVGAAWAFGAQAVVVALGAVLVSRVVLPPHGRDPERTTHLRHDIAEGFRWVLHHAAVRTLVLTIFTSTSPSVPPGRCSSCTPRSGSASATSASDW